MRTVACVVITVLALLSEAVAGVPETPATADCEHTVANMMVVQKPKLESTPGMYDNVLSALQLGMATRCHEDQWSQDSLKCLAGAQESSDLKSCLGKLTKDQQDGIQKLFTETLAKGEAEVAHRILVRKRKHDPKWMSPALSASICKAGQIKDALAKQIKSEHGHAKQFGEIVDKSKIDGWQQEIRASDKWIAHERSSLRQLKATEQSCQSEVVKQIMAHSVDNADFERRLDKRMHELGLQGATVRCPRGVIAYEGASFNCGITVDRKSHDVVVTIMGVAGTSLNMETAWAEGQSVLSSKVETSVGEAIGMALSTVVAVGCGERLRFLEADRTLACDVTAGTLKAKAIVQFDVDQNVTSWKVQPAILARAKLEGLLTPSVRAKTSPTVNIVCGSEPLMLRPADGVVSCTVENDDERAILKVTVDKELNLGSWVIVAK